MVFFIFNHNIDGFSIRLLFHSPQNREGPAFPGRFLLISNNKEYFLNLEKISVNGIQSYTYIKRILYGQVSTRNSYKFLGILDVYYTYFFDVNDRKNDPKVVRKLNVHYTCNLERIQFHLFKRY